MRVTDWDTLLMTVGISTNMLSYLGVRYDLGYCETLIEYLRTLLSLLSANFTLSS